MNARFEAKTLVRLVFAVVLVCVMTTLIAGPRSSEAADGYGISAPIVGDEIIATR